MDNRTVLQKIVLCGLPLLISFQGFSPSAWAQQEGDEFILLEGYEMESLLPVGELISGIARYQDDILVCEYDRGRILRITLTGDVTVLIDDLDTPVDVEVVERSVWVLLQEPGVLVNIDPETGDRKVMAEDLFEPTAFALGNRDSVYVTEFFSGNLIEIDLNQNRKRVIYDGLNNPADLVVTEAGNLVVTQQIGRDLSSGAVTVISPQRLTVLDEWDAVDPTGISLSSNGILIFTSFHIQACQSGGVLSISDNQQTEPLACGFVGPTSLMELPNGWIAVIEETTNSVVLLFPDGTTEYLVQGSVPFVDFDRFPDGEIVVVDEKSTFGIRLLDSNVRFLPAEQRLFANLSTPNIEIGGDGNLYVYHSFLQQVQVYSRKGELLNLIDVPANVNRMLSDPAGGIALIVNQGNENTLLRLDQNGSSIQEPVSGNTGVLFLDPNGEMGRLELSEDRMARKSSYLIAAEDNSRIWFVPENGRRLFVQTGVMTEFVAEFDERVVHIETGDEEGVIVGTEAGKLFHVTEAAFLLETDTGSPTDTPTESGSLPPPSGPETTVNKWFLYE